MNDDEKVVYFGETDARNRRLRFGIKKVDRSRHMYAIGKTGMGKSTLLENLAVQDIQNGDGLCFIDPHGKSADLLLEYVPEHRIKDVVYFAPFDMEHPISFNVMEDVGPERRYLVANGLMAAFKKIWVDAWSARMEYILGNIMLALLEYPGSTLVGVNRMLTDKDFRKEVVNNITDPSVKSFWVNEYANYTDKFAAEAAPAIQNKVGQFVANPLIRNIIGQSKSSFDIRQIMEDKKILIINLSKGRVGEANANLLGSMLITKIYLAAMSRADLKEKELAAAPNFYLYVDEFQSFANESFADILSEARKYKLNLCIAHQYIEQMTDEVRAAVFGNVGTMVCYRVGAYDAEVLEKEFAPQFTAEDIVNLQKYQMYLKLMIDGVTSPPFSASGMPPIPRPETMYVNEIIASSRSMYAQPRQKVEEEILNWIQTPFGKGGGSGGNAGGGNSGGGDRGGQGQGSGDRGGQRSGAPSGQGGSGSGGSQPRFSQQGGGSSQSSQRPPSLEGQGGPRRYDEPRSDSRGPRDSRDSRGPSQASGRPGGFSGSQAPVNRSEQRTPSQEQPRRSERPASMPSQQPQQAPREEKNPEAQPYEPAAMQQPKQTVSLGQLRGDREQKNDQKAPKAENLNALRDALLSVMGASTSVADQNEQTKREDDVRNGVRQEPVAAPATPVQEDQSFREPERPAAAPLEQRAERQEPTEAGIPNQQFQKEVPRPREPEVKRPAEPVCADTKNEPAQAHAEISEEELKKLLG